MIARSGASMSTALKEIGLFSRVRVCSASPRTSSNAARLKLVALRRRIRLAMERRQWQLTKQAWIRLALRDTYENI